MLLLGIEHGFALNAQRDPRVTAKRVAKLLEGVDTRQFDPDRLVAVAAIKDLLNDTRVAPDF
ncbi:MAG: hypothetical protein IPG25_13295 [Proteobacteria bacterium]|nr:hypothetical protein [Pseudomonadota bacterium]